MSKRKIEVLVAIACLAIGFFAVSAYVKEQLARAEAEAKYEAAQEQIESIKKDAAKKIAALKKRREEVKTPAEAIQAIPEVSNLPLKAHAIEGVPAEVAVDAKQLYEELAQCKEDRVNLEACQAEVGQKDKQVAALKKKPNFLRRTLNIIKQVGLGIAIGMALKGWAL